MALTIPPSTKNELPVTNELASDTIEKYWIKLNLNRHLN